MTCATVTVQEQTVLELAGMPQGPAALLAAAGLAGLLALTAALYRAERRAGASRRLRARLALLRCAVLLAVALIWLEPTRATYAQRTVHARVALLLDTSASMRVPDAAPPAEAGATTQAARVPRGTAVRQVLAARQGALLRALAAANELVVYAFGEQPRVLLPAGRPAGAEALAALDEPSDAWTDLDAAFQAVLGQAGDTPLAAIVVISDGATNRGSDPQELAEQAARLGVPVYTVGVGGTVEPPNARVARLDAPVSVPRGDPLDVRVELEVSGHEAPQELDVVLAGRPAGAPDAARVLLRRRVRFEPGAGPVTLRHALPAPEPGEHVLAARIEPLPDEVVTLDNTREASVVVLDAQLRVLLVSGRPSYEYRYLTRQLERDRTIEVACWLQSADPQAVRDGDVALDHLPRQPQELFGFDVVLLLDPDPREFDAQLALALRRFVDEFGGGLALVAGPHYTARFVSDPRLESLTAVLPVVPEADAPVGPGPYRTQPRAIRVPQTARGEALVRLDADPQRNAEIWERLPGLYWHLPVRQVRPLATVLLEVEGPASGGSGVLAAAQPAGSGRVLFIGSDSTWRWRRRAEDLRARFWLNVVRWLAQPRREGGSPRGRIVVDREVVPVGQLLHVEAQVLDPQYRPWDAPAVEAYLDHPDGTRQRVALEALGARPGWYAGRVRLDRPGRHALRIALPGGAEEGPDGELVRRIWAAQPQQELLRVRQRSESLQALAERTGGAYLPLSRAEELAERIRPAARVLPPERVAAQPLWDRGWVIFLLVGMLALEWILRRHSHLL